MYFLQIFSRKWLFASTCKGQMPFWQLLNIELERFAEVYTSTSAKSKYSKMLATYRGTVRLRYFNRYKVPRLQRKFCQAYRKDDRSVRGSLTKLKVFPSLNFFCFGLEETVTKFLVQIHSTNMSGTPCAWSAGWKFILRYCATRSVSVGEQFFFLLTNKGWINLVERD